MKLEKLSRGRFKNFIIILVVISIIGITFINRSKAKYRVTQSIQIVNGEVNYKVPDLNVLALYKQIEEGYTNDENYESITDVPTGSYRVNTDKSYCTFVGSETKFKDIPMKYENGRISVSINKKGTKCYVWLDVSDPVKNTLDRLGLQLETGTPNFANTSCINGTNTLDDTKNCKEETNGLYKITDSDGKDTYYFRGTVNNNWVKMGIFYWRIIRFNGNGSIRLIYNGTGSIAENYGGTQLSDISKFNSTSTDQRYVRFAYGINSTIKNALDDWYEKNLISYTSKLDGAAGFCNDGDESISTSNKDFPPYDRLHTGKLPSLACSHDNLFTTSGNTNGNEKLTYPIGLITADEAALAGGVYGSINSGYYLYTGQHYWTMSPFYFYNGNAHVFYVDDDGRLNFSLVYNSYGVRPVINLKTDTIFTTAQSTNKGTKDNPYIVQ